MHQCYPIKEIKVNVNGYQIKLQKLEESLLRTECCDREDMVYKYFLVRNKIPTKLNVTKLFLIITELRLMK